MEALSLSAHLGPPIRRTLKEGNIAVKGRIVLALVAALPLEAINFFLFAPPLDVGYDGRTPAYIQLLGLQWVVFHWPGLFLMDRAERLANCHASNVVAGCTTVDAGLLFAVGYIDTALLLALGFLVLYWFTSRRKPALAENG